jgi:WD40 repeat protein
MQFLEAHERAVQTLLFTPDGSLLSSGEEGTLCLWCPFGDRTDLARTEKPVGSLACSTDGRWLAAGAKGGTLEIWDLAGRKVLSTRPACGCEVRGLAFVQDDATVAFALGGESPSATQSPGVYFWDWREGMKRLLPANVATFVSIRALTSLLEKRLLAWITDKRSIVVWNMLQSSSSQFHLKNPCRAMALSPDGKTVAAAVEWNVILFDLERKQEKQTLMGHKGRVTSLAYSPDGRHLMTGSWDRTIKFWDTRTGRESASFEWPVGQVNAVGFAPDGLRAAAGGHTGTIVIWDVDV